MVFRNPFSGYQAKNFSCVIRLYDGRVFSPLEATTGFQLDLVFKWPYYLTKMIESIQHSFIFSIPRIFTRFWLLGASHKTQQHTGMSDIYMYTPGQKFIEFFFSELSHRDKGEYQQFVNSGMVTYQFSKKLRNIVCVGALATVQCP